MGSWFVSLLPGCRRQFSIRLKGWNLGEISLRNACYGRLVGGWGLRNIGFVIVNGDEEFLAGHSVSDGAIARQWAPFVGLAEVFRTIREADKVVSQLESCYPLYVLGLKETRTQYAVYPPREGHYPAWLFEQ